MANNVYDDVRLLESEVARLQAENRNLELDNAQWRQKAEDNQHLYERELVQSKRLLRDNTELATLMEGWITNLNQGLSRYREHLSRRNAPDFNVKHELLRRMEADVDANGARPAQGLPKEGESAGSRMLRTSFNELDR